MRCEKVLGQLSLFLDEVLEYDLATGVAQHLRACLTCNREFARLKKLRNVLSSLQPVETPDYLRNLVERKINTARQHSWRSSLQSALEYRWSRIRTTEGIWYLTKLTGAMATLVLFIAISSAMNPMDLEFGDQLTSRGFMSQAPRSQQLAVGVLTNLGLPPVEAQKRPISPSDPKTNDLNLVNLGQNASSSANDDMISVVMIVDRSGRAKVQRILEYPADESLLSAVTDWISSTSWRPASRNGRAIDSQLVLTFSKIFVRE
jgi:hypothetical protein